ncbi:MAG: hypothetical protein IPL55_21535 [Saprospiraceae bacterium]|nr:hypothetical protein [Saprospiraceae bacterium]
MGHSDIFKKYITSYKNKKGIELQIDLENYDIVIADNFDYGSYLDVMDEIRKHEMNDELQKIKDNIYSIADRVYFQKFYREISLEEKVKPEGFSFDVSIYKPINASFLI